MAGAPAPTPPHQVNWSARTLSAAWRPASRRPPRDGSQHQPNLLQVTRHRAAANHPVGEPFQVRQPFELTADLGPQQAIGIKTPPPGPGVGSSPLKLSTGRVMALAAVAPIWASPSYPARPSDPRRSPPATPLAPGYAALPGPATWPLMLWWPAAESGPPRRAASRRIGCYADGPGRARPASTPLTAKGVEVLVPRCWVGVWRALPLKAPVGQAANGRNHFRQAVFVGQANEQLGRGRRASSPP